MKKSKLDKIDNILTNLGLDPKTVSTEAFDEDKRKRRERPPVSLGKCPVSGKVMFKSETMAKKAMRIRLNKSSNASKLRCYLCDDCSRWHMSSYVKK